MKPSTWPPLSSPQCSYGRSKQKFRSHEAFVQGSPKWWKSNKQVFFKQLRTDGIQAVCFGHPKSIRNQGHHNPGNYKKVKPISGRLTLTTTQIWKVYELNKDLSSVCAAAVRVSPGQSLNTLLDPAKTRRRLRDNCLTTFLQEIVNIEICEYWQYFDKKLGILRIMNIGNILIRN